MFEGILQPAHQISSMRGGGGMGLQTRHDI